MNIEDIIKQHFVFDQEYNIIETDLDLEHEVDWTSINTHELKKQFYKLQDSLCIQIVFERSGSLENGYQYVHPRFNFSSKKTIIKPMFRSLKNQNFLAKKLAAKYFDQYGLTNIEHIYKNTYFQEPDDLQCEESVYSIENVLLRKTIFCHSLSNEIIEYDVVEKENIEEIKFYRIRK